MTPPTGAELRRGPFSAGERVQLTDPKGRLHTITLEPGKQFHTHRGRLAHDDLIGMPDGSVVTNTAGVEYLALRPLLSDYVMSMPRGAAVVYPKDAGQIVTMADIFPGAGRRRGRGRAPARCRCRCCGRWGTTGRVHSFERREDFADIARANVEAFFGGRPPGLDSHRRRPRRGAAADRRARQRRPGRARHAGALGVPRRRRRRARARRGADLLRRHGDPAVPGRRGDARRTARFTEPQAWESLVRGWHLEGLAVRPQHRMHGHTGFLVTTRRLAPGVTPAAAQAPPGQGLVTARTPSSDWTRGRRRAGDPSDKRVRRVSTLGDREPARLEDGRPAGSIVEQCSTDEPRARPATATRERARGSRARSRSRRDRRAAGPWPRLAGAAARRSRTGSPQLQSSSWPR